ncbi:MAG TPA: hypothetical protein VGK02_11020 [Candidatus Aquicultor sp.]
MALLYHPNSPLNLFPYAHVEELWLWSKYAIFLSSTLLVFTLLAVDSDPRGRDVARSLSAFIAFLQGMINLPPVVLYFIFLHGAQAAEISTRGGHIIISYTELFLHMMLVIVSLASSAWLCLVKRPGKAAAVQAIPMVDAHA